MGFAYYLDAVDARILCNVTVLMKAFLDHLSLTKVDAQLNVLEHDGFHHGESIAAGSL